MDSDINDIVKFVEPEAPEMCSIILVGHGARSPQWAATLLALKEALTAHLAEEKLSAAVALAYLEFMSPNLDEMVAQCLARGDRHIVIAPIFIAPSGHVNAQIAPHISQLATMHPAVHFQLLPAIGQLPEVIQAMAQAIYHKTASEVRDIFQKIN